MANVCNQDIRKAIQDSGVKYYELAHELGISHGTLSVWLRYELSQEKKDLIFSILGKLRGER